MKKRKTKESAAVTETPAADAPAAATDAPAAPALREDIPTQPYFEPPVHDVAPDAPAAASWDGPTRVAEADEIADLTAQSVQAEDPAVAGEAAPAAEADVETPAVESTARLESIVESLLFASDRPLNVADLKRLLGERDAKKVMAALDALAARHDDTGIQLASVAGGFQFRTHPRNGAWVSKLVAGRPQRLSRALLETLSIIAYRQPVTRPEIDEIRGVDCGPVLKTLLERNLIRMIGKKEDVGRPILYGTTPEFLRTFSLRDLAELPTLREFHELSEAQMAEVNAKTEAAGGEAAASPEATAPIPPPAPIRPPDAELQEEEDGLLDELDRATAAAAKAGAAPPSEPEAGADAGEPRATDG
jgi:segregation and condensation protein B